MDKITNKDGKLQSVVGRDAVEAFRYKVMISGLKLKQKTGMEPTRGVRILKLAQQTTGLKTRDYDKLIERLQIMMNEQVSKCLIIEDGEAPE
jgi:hypothetical protein